jgi:hypothetical protein
MVFDLLVLRLISVILTLTSTKEFYFIHPLSSMRLSWYTYLPFGNLMVLPLRCANQITS